MPDLNSVNLTGRLTRDPELKHMASGDAVCSMRIAVNGRRKGQHGQWEDAPNFVNVSAFGRHAETCAQYLSKGRRVAVAGRLSWREWEQDGTKRQSLDVVANDVIFLGGEDAQGSSPPVQSGMAVDTTDYARAAPGPDDDIPF